MAQKQYSLYYLVQTSRLTGFRAHTLIDDLTFQGTLPLPRVALKCRTLKSLPHSWEILISKGLFGTFNPGECDIQHLE